MKTAYGEKTSPQHPGIDHDSIESKSKNKLNERTTLHMKRENRGTWRSSLSKPESKSHSEEG